MPVTGPRRALRRGLLVVAALFVLACLVFGFQAWRAGRALLEARGQAQTLETAMAAGNVPVSLRTAQDLQDSANRAHRDTSSALWDVVGHIPFAGRNVAAMQTASATLDETTRDAVPHLVHLAQVVAQGDLRPHHGRVDLATIHELAPPVRRAAAAMDDSERTLAAVDADGLMYPVSDVIRSLQGRFAAASSAMDSASDALDVLPAMLGEGGPRRYLLLIQNNAEIRSTGGISGSWAILHADHGKLSMGVQGSAVDVPRLAKPVLPLTAGERAVYGSALGTDLRDLNLSPDFPRVARMAAALIGRDHGPVDAVFSVDPLALSYVLQGTGPVKVSHGYTLNSGNAAQVLLNQIYLTMPNGQMQDDFYAATARKIFNTIVAGRGDQLQVVRGLVTAAAQDRVLAWSGDHVLTDVIRRTRVSGELPGRSGHTPQVGVYLNDATASKMEAYLRYDATVRSRACTAAGVQTLDVTTRLRSIAPPNAARLSPYVTGLGVYAARGSMQMNLRIYAPAGGTISSLVVDGHTATIGGGTHKGRQVAVVPVLIAPGKRVVVQARMSTGAGQDGDPVLTRTPDVELRPNRLSVPSACAGGSGGSGG